MITLKVCDTTGRKVTFLDVEESLIGPIPFARLRELLQTDLGPDFTFAYVAPGKTKSMALARNVEDDYDFNISSNATILVMPASAPANVVASSTIFVPPPTPVVQQPAAVVAQLPMMPVPASTSTSMGAFSIGSIASGMTIAPNNSNSNNSVTHVHLDTTSAQKQPESSRASSFQTVSGTLQQSQPAVQAPAKKPHSIFSSAAQKKKEEAESISTVESLLKRTSKLDSHKTNDLVNKLSFVCDCVNEAQYDSDYPPGITNVAQANAVRELFKQQYVRAIIACFLTFLAAVRRRPKMDASSLVLFSPGHSNSPSRIHQTKYRQSRRHC
jgi:hypothetical protein